jgi:hypothetical protein
MKREKVTFKSLGYELSGVVEYPDGYISDALVPGVILFHGLTNTKEDCPLIKETAEALTKEGFVTFRFDFFGSGESPGQLKDKTWSILRQNALDAIKVFLATVNVNKIGLFGRSTGGTIAVLCGTHPSIQAFVLASPFILIARSIPEFRKVMELERKLEKEGKVLPGTGKYKGDYDFNEKFFEEAPIFEKKIMKNLTQMSRVLVLATTPDTKVPLSNAATVLNVAKDPKEMHIFEGVDHDYKGKEKEAVELTVKWFKRWLL